MLLLLDAGGMDYTASNSAEKCAFLLHVDGYVDPYRTKQAFYILKTLAHNVGCLVGMVSQ